jgi:hypothetical protein
MKKTRKKQSIWKISGKVVSKVSSILTNHDTYVKSERMVLLSTKTSFIFHKFTSSCSEGTPKDNDKNRKK